MRSKLVLAMVATFAFGGAAAADSAPKFDVGPACRAAAKRAVPVGDPSVCMRQEGEARDKLVSEWGTFNAADKGTCVPVSSMGGRPTYTELLTCLELSREARNLRNRDASSSTTGMVPTGRPLRTRTPAPAATPPGRTQ
jgi:hypothetical protein